MHGSRKNKKYLGFKMKWGVELKACKALKERLKLWENSLELGQS